MYFDVTSTRLEVTSMRLEVTSTRLEVTSMHVEVTSTRLEVTSTRLEVTSMHVEVTSTRLEVTSMHVEVTSMRLEVTSMHVDVTSTRLGVTSMHAEVTSARPATTSWPSFAYDSRDVARIGSSSQRKAAHDREARPAAEPSTASWIVVLVAGIVANLPALRCPFILDDYWQLAMLRGTFPVPRGPLDLYNFVDDPSRAALTARGFLPWWSDPALTMRFFRPLSSALVWAEHRLLGDHPTLLHAHSFAWWIAAVLGTGALLRRLLPPRAAWLGTLVFALAPCHSLPLAWLANRPPLIALALGTPALAAYHRFRDDRSPAWGGLAALLFGLAMLAGEYAFCLAGYVVAIELVTPLRRRNARSLVSRAAGLLPFVVPAALVLLARRAGGFSARAGFYTDPLEAPLAFAALVPRRLSMLLLDAWLSLNHDTLPADVPWWQLALALVAVVLVVGPPMRNVAQSLDRDSRRTATWLLLGSVLAAVPLVAAGPRPRLLAVSLVGIGGVVGLFLDRAWSLLRESAPVLGGLRRWHAWLAVVVLGAAHLVHAPATSWLLARGFQRAGMRHQAHAAELAAKMAEQGASDLVVLRGWAGSLYLPFSLDPSAAPPARWQILSWTDHVLAMRVDARTLDLIAPPAGALFPAGFPDLYRNERNPIPAGSTFELPGLEVKVLATSARGPQRVRFRFDRELEDPTLRWVTEKRDDVFADVVLPREGFGQPFDP